MKGKGKREKEKGKERKEQRTRMKGKLERKKGKPQEREKAKPQERTVDYFPRGGQLESARGEDFMFNKAPVKLIKKRKKFDVVVPETGRKEKKAKLEKEEEVELEENEGQLEVAPSASLKSKQSMSRIRRLKTMRGCLILAAVLEVTKYYLIVNYSRNKKGYISSADIAGFAESIKEIAPGDFIACTVIRSEGSDLRKESGHMNRKMQLTMNPHIFNACLSIESVVPNMILPAVVESVEEKGYLLDFGIQDTSQGFLKFEELPKGTKLVEKQWVMVSIASVNRKSRLLPCTLLLQNRGGRAGYTEGMSLETLKPGMLVQAQVKQVLINGLYVSFLRGIEGTVFVDHLKNPPEKYKKTDKLLLRIIMVDLSQKIVALSELPHIVGLAPISTERLPIPVGSNVDSTTITAEAYGGSCLVNVPSALPYLVFLHKSHVDPKDKSELKVGASTGPIKLKEFNFFDGVYLASTRGELVDAELLTWQSIEVAQVVQGRIERVVEDSVVVIKINEFISGQLMKEHTADRSVVHIPEKLKQVGKNIKLRVFSINPLNKSLVLTRKKLLMQPHTPIVKSREELEVGQEVYGVVGKELDNGCIIKFFGDIAGLLHKAEEQQALKPGQTIRVFVAYNDIKHKRIGLGLTPEIASAIREKQLNQEDEYRGLFGEVHTDVNAELGPKLLSAVAVGHTHTLRTISSELDPDVLSEASKYVVMKTTDLEENFYVYVPKYHISDNKQHLDKLAEVLASAKAGVSREFQGVILNMLEHCNIIVASLKPSLVSARKCGKLPSGFEEIVEGGVYYGYISKVIDKGVFVSFLGNLKGFLSNAEIENNFEKKQHCWVGKALRVSTTRLNHEEQNMYLSTRYSRVYAAPAGTQKAYRRVLLEVQQELKSQIEEYYEEQMIIEASYTSSDSGDWGQIHYGDYLRSSVQMLKEYGVIVQSGDRTGFIMNEHRRKGKDYAVGQEVLAKILDLDRETNLLDLSHGKHFLELPQSTKSSLAECQHTKLPPYSKLISKFPKLKPTKARVELIKESYAIVSFLEFKCILAMIPIRLFNRDEKESVLNKLGIGHVLNAKLCGYSSEHRLYFAVPAVASLRRVWDTEHVESWTAQRKHSNAELNVDSLELGQQLTGTVSSVQGYTAFVHINRKVYGRLHKAQCGSDQRFGELQKGSVVTGRIINITRASSSAICKVDLSLESVPSAEELANEGQVGVAKSVHWGNTYPIVVELSSYIRAMVHYRDIVKDPRELDTVRSTVKDGTIIRCFPLFSASDIGKTEERLRVALFPVDHSHTKQEDNFKIGDLVVCRCMKVKAGHGIAVQLAEKIAGYIDITEVADEFHANPFSEACNKGVLTARILDTLQAKDELGPRFKLSSRRSLCDNKLWKVLNEASTFEFQQQFDYLTEEGDMRSKFIKFGTEWIKAGMMGIGYVSNINDKGCFIKAGHKLTVRASLGELSDTAVMNPLSLFKVNDVVLFRVVSVTEPKVSKGDAVKHVNVSLKESVVKYGISLSASDLRVGQLYPCLVRVYEPKNTLRVQIKGSRVMGLAKAAPAELAPNELINCRVERIENEKEARLKILLRFDSRIDTSTEPTKIEELYQKIERQRREAKPDSSTLMQEIVDFNVEEPEDLLVKPELELLQEIERKPGEEEEEEGKTIQQTFHEPEEDEEEEESMEDVSEGRSGDESPDSDDEIDEGQRQKQRKLKSKIKQEKKLRKTEKRSLMETQAESVEEFEKQIVASPNNSYLWLQYVAFLLDHAGIDSARRLIKRAISSMDITQEQEKLNLWIGYLNLESSYGTTESLQEAAKQAVDVNDKKKIYKALAGIYYCSQRYEFALDVYKLTVKKFHNSVSVWETYIEALFKLQEAKSSPGHEEYKSVARLECLAPREALSRALQALDKRKHVGIIVKYGMLEYKHGGVENARTMFEGILSSYPSKTDIWGVYFDMELKYANSSKDYIRSLFERCLKLGLKEKKMQFFYKRYLDYELANGTEHTANAVREKISKLVESKMADT